MSPDVVFAAGSMVASWFVAEIRLLSVVYGYRVSTEISAGFETSAASGADLVFGTGLPWRCTLVIIRFELEMHSRISRLVLFYLSVGTGLPVGLGGVGGDLKPREERRLSRGSAR